MASWTHPLEDHFRSLFIKCRVEKEKTALIEKRRAERLQQMVRTVLVDQSNAEPQALEWYGCSPLARLVRRQASNLRAAGSCLGMKQDILASGSAVYNNTSLCPLRFPAGQL